MALAPSAHNTQPWKFAVGESSIDVFVDWDRHLDVSDPTLRQLYVSLGCTIENGVVAGEHAGMEVEVTYFPEGETKEKPVARLTLQKASSDNTGDTKVFEAIPSRRNDRARYNSQALTDSERASITSLKNENVVLVEEAQEKKKVAEISAKGTWKTLSDPKFKGELAHWVRSSLTKKHDGMPGDAMGMPAPIALIAPWIIKPAPIHKMQTPEVKQQVETAATLAIIATAEDTSTARMEAGRILERLWLEATAADLAGSVIAAPVESGEEIRQEMQSLLGTQKYPQTMLRIGHSKNKNLKATPRRDVSEVIG